jgi:hypothetical protein
MFMRLDAGQDCVKRDRKSLFFSQNHVRLMAGMKPAGTILAVVEWAIKLFPRI